MFFLFFTKAYAQYTLMEPLPGLGGGKVADYVPVVVKLGVALAAILAVVVIVIAGFMYITSGGDPGKNEKAKGFLLNAIIGLLIAVGYWLILQAINPAILGGDVGLDTAPQGQVDFTLPGGGTTGQVGGGGGQGPTVQCTSNADCPSGVCAGGVCVPIERPVDLESEPNLNTVDYGSNQQEAFTYDAQADSSNWDWLGSQNFPMVSPGDTSGETQDFILNFTNLDGTASWNCESAKDALGNDVINCENSTGGGGGA